MKNWILAYARQGGLAEREKEEQLWVWRTAQASLISNVEAEIQARIKAIMIEKKKCKH